MARYNTHQKTAIISFFTEHQTKSYSAEEVSSYLPAIPRSTLYRLLSQLSAEGIIRQETGVDRTSLYRHLGSGCPEHMHIRCCRCGRTEHLDAKTTRLIEKLVASSSGFEALDSTIFEGLCSDCMKERK